MVKSQDISQNVNTWASMGFSKWNLSQKYLRISCKVDERQQSEGIGEANTNGKWTALI